MSKFETQIQLCKSEMGKIDPNALMQIIKFVNYAVLLV
jgi:Glu-tRNA(Gln) amidotransferase subunit E-like FAD-binding protein